MTSITTAHEDDTVLNITNSPMRSPITLNEALEFLKGKGLTCKVIRGKIYVYQGKGKHLSDEEAQQIGDELRAKGCLIQ